MFKKILAVIGATLFFFTAVGLVAQANVFNPTDGTVTVMASGGTSYVDYDGGANQVNGVETVASVVVPAGRYLVQAKAWIDQTVGSESFAQCYLVDLGNNDRTRLNASTVNYAAVVAQEVTEDDEEFTIEYSCVSDARVDVYNISLIATTISAYDIQ